MKYLKTFMEQSVLCNESIRNKMTPKPKDDIKKSMYEYFKEDKVDKNYNLIPAFDKMKFFDLDNLYVKIDWEDYYDDIESYLENLVEGHESYEVKDNDKGIFTCYPDLKIALYGDGIMTDSWYFDGSHIDGIINYIMENGLNESIRDKMTPKSEEQIESKIPSIIKKLRKLLKINNIIYEIILDKEEMFRNSFIELYIELKHKSYLLEIYHPKEKSKPYRLSKDHIYSGWKTLYLSTNEDDMFNYIKSLLSLNESIQDFNPDEIRNKEAEHFERELAYRKKMRSEDDNDYDFDELRDVITDEIGDLKNYHITASKKKDEIYIEYESEEVGRVKIFNPNDESDEGYFEVNGKMHSIDADEIRNFYHYLNQEMKKL